LFSAAYSAKRGSVRAAFTTIIPEVKAAAASLLAWESEESSTWQQVVLQMSKLTLRGWTTW
jgi:hypothetical protein